ncbi:hypothetical protein [Burkholderia sp. BCC0097]|uniref:hypothetical protein n=1 Tax=Burkholderia sp. BCC0097 TaxID=2676289 RepID=UPI00158CC63D|nr:hypothetical protein [Burkholderia sp. BCC0097]
MTTHDEKSPAPEQASEAVQQRPGTDKTLTEAATPTAEGIVDVRASDGNGTSPKVIRADALRTIAEFPITDPANMDALNMRKIAYDALAASPVEQPAAAPTIQHRLHGIARIDLELVEREARALAHTSPAPASTDERAAFVELMGYDRPETECVATDVWDSQRATWLEALAFACACSANGTGAEGMMALPHWFETFLTNVCEIPDRNSPEGEPDAVVATLNELRNCAINAIEQCVSYAVPAQSTEDVRAWETDDGRVITDMQKQQALRDGGASASSVTPYAHALYRRVPAHATAAAIYQILTEEGAWLDTTREYYERVKSDPALARVVYGAPQPPAQADARDYAMGHRDGWNECLEAQASQADARFGLTDEQRRDLEKAMAWCPHGSQEAETIRALLQGAKQ